MKTKNPGESREARGTAALPRDVAIFFFFALCLLFTLRRRAPKMFHRAAQKRHVA
jgi:hypothetical protein